MNRKLLRHTVHRRAENLKPGPLLGLGQVLGEPVGLLLGLGEFVGDRTPEFRRRLTARLADRRDRRLGLMQMALLDPELFLLLHQQLQHLEIAELRTQLLLRPLRKRARPRQRAFWVRGISRRPFRLPWPAGLRSEQRV